MAIRSPLELCGGRDAVLTSIRKGLSKPLPDKKSVNALRKLAMYAPELSDTKWIHDLISHKPVNTAGKQRLLLSLLTMYALSLEDLIAPITRLRPHERIHYQGEIKKNRVGFAYFTGGSYFGPKLDKPAAESLKRLVLRIHICQSALRELCSPPISTGNVMKVRKKARQ